MPLTIDDLKKVYIHELKDIHSAEKQLLEQLPRMAEQSEDEELTRSLQGHLETTKTHLQRIEKLFEDSDYSAEGHRCRGMEGLLEEARETAGAEQGAARDALTISATQRVQHYLMAGYGSARAMAEKLGSYEAADTLIKGLDESRDLDRSLTGLAMRSVNFRAMTA